MAQRVDVQYVNFYTHGSVARRVAPAIPFNVGVKPRPKKRKMQRIYVDPVAMLGIVVAVCMLVMMALGLSQLRAEQQKTADMVEYVEILRMENERLQIKYTAECNLEVVEKTALALGMIPQAEAEHISVQVELPQAQDSEPVSIWQRIGTFLTGLFA